MDRPLSRGMLPALLACAALQPAALGAQETPFVPVTGQMLADPDPADWLMVSRTYDEQRYSPLDQINRANVAQLRLAWARGLPPGIQESTPVVYRGVMYLLAPGASIQAVDATNGDLIWEYQRDYPRGVDPKQGRSKSIGIFEDMIYFGAPDGYLVALDARTGALRWETKVDNGDIAVGGLIVADGKVITNRTCADGNDKGTRSRCFIAAHDARTGKELWKFHTTAAPGEPGGDSWGDMPAEERVAGPWGQPGSYDPRRKLLFWGVANPNPYTRHGRHGDKPVPVDAPSALYSNSTVALDVETGKLAWYYQELPGDDWDADHNHERILVRTKVAPDARHVKWINPAIKPGETRDVVVTVAEGGGLYVVDQATGKFLWARPFPYDDPNLNMNHIDVRTGATRLNVDRLFRKDGDENITCYFNTRSLWQTAYDPGENALYVPFHDQCLKMKVDYSSPLGWRSRVGVIRPGSDPQKFMNIGKVDLATGEMKVIYSQPQPANGSALTTAGGLLFFGDLNRRFRALDVRDGKPLWESVVGGMIMTSTITYAVKGKQYVMVFTGQGLTGGVSHGPLKLTAKAMPAPVYGHNAIYVFALP